MKNVVKISVLSLFLAFAGFLAIPDQAHALLLDSLFEDAPAGPHCLFMDCASNRQPTSVNNSINNSYNNNTGSFNNSNTGNSSGSHSGSTYSTSPYAPTQPVYVPYPSPVYTPYPVPTYNYWTSPYAPTPTYYYNQLSVSCSANTTYTTTGSYVTWTAYAYGGYYSNYNYGNYSYSWSGTDGLSGNSSSVTTFYSNPGTKYATVTVYSQGQTASAQCSNSVTVSGQYYYQQPVYYQPISYTNGFQVACAADTTSTRVGMPVTWSVEAIYPGYSTGNFSYSWSGSEGLYGSQARAVMNYTSPGTKTASVTVIAPNGQSATATCANNVTVRSASSGVSAQPAPTPVVASPAGNANSAAALFSLGNVPWGWVAILIILILLGFIFYLVFNKKKL
jgi:hypothetical protein